METELRAIAERFFGKGASAEHLAVVYGDGDVIVYAAGKRPGSWGAALAGFRWNGERMHLAIGRMPDPKAQREIELWVASSVRPRPGSPGLFEAAGE